MKASFAQMREDNAKIMKLLAKSTKKAKKSKNAAVMTLIPVTLRTVARMMGPTTMGNLVINVCLLKFQIIKIKTKLILKRTLPLCRLKS